MRSMTGFGAGEATGSHWRASAELSGVNRKQLDLAINLPQTLTQLEPGVRKQIQSRISRGRINARINLTCEADQSSVLQVAQALADQYIEAVKRIAEQSGIPYSLKAEDLLRCPGLFRLEDTEVEIDEVEPLVTQATEIALENLSLMQEEEGSHLKQDLETRLANIEAEIDRISGFSREVVDSYRQSLFARLTDCGLEIDLNDDRVLREIALYAERSDITEEVIRIGSHAIQFRKYFNTAGEPVGRPLDFLCQELNRELNTIGSKANHAKIAQAIVNSKTELEKIREQVQNIQ